MAKGVFADRNGTVYRVQSKGGKVMWQKIEYFPNGSFGTITAIEPGDGKHPWTLKESALERRLERIENLLGGGIPATPGPPKSTKSCRTIDEVVRDMLKAKETKAVEKGERGVRHLKDLKSRLGRIARDFTGQPIDEVIKGPTIQEYIDELKCESRNGAGLVELHPPAAGRTKINYYRKFRELTNFAIRRRDLPKEAAEEIAYVEAPDAKSKPPEVYTPDEMIELLAVARPEMLPYLVLGGFCGMRSAEIERLNWSKVDLSEGHIKLDEDVAKIGQRRVLVLQPNALLWLKTFAREEGLVLAFKSWYNHLRPMVDALNQRRRAAGLEAEFIWKHNALRDSYISYRLAVTNNADGTAHEAGNSRAMIQSRYNALATPREGRAWFEISPN